MRDKKKVIGLYEDKLLKRTLLIYQIHKYYQKSDTAQIHTDNWIYNNIPLSEIITK